MRYPDLAAKIESEWKAKGQHSDPTDRKLDQAILHTDNKTRVHVHHRRHRRDLPAAPGHSTSAAKTEKLPAFNITFAVN